MTWTYISEGLPKDWVIKMLMFCIFLNLVEVFFFGVYSSSGCYLSPVLRASRWPERLNEWQEGMLNILAWQRIYLPFTHGCFVCLSSSPPPRDGCQSLYQIRSLKGNCRESSLYLLRGQNYLDVEYITNVPLPVLHMK